MGFRFRKSFNFGGFRFNISKSGIGYSYGTKGARITKTAKGTKRTTLSIPGTGLSYINETKNKERKPTMINRSDCYIPETIIIVEENIPVPQSWMSEHLGLTAKETELFMAIINNSKNQTFTMRDIAAVGCAMSATIYNGLYNKNVINKNEDKTYSLNTDFINKVGYEYQKMEAARLRKEEGLRVANLMPKGHSIILHILFGWIVMYIPAIYYTFSKKHYWHV